MQKPSLFIWKNIYGHEQNHFSLYFKLFFFVRFVLEFALVVVIGFILISLVNGFHRMTEISHKVSIVDYPMNTNGLTLVLQLMSIPLVQERIYSVAQNQNNS
mgnify:CR=1 FL=1